MSIFRPRGAFTRAHGPRGSVLCTFSHRWTDIEVRPVSWLHSGEVRESEIKYRKCGRCGSWERQDFWTGQYRAVEKPYDVEPNPGIAPDLD